MIRLAFKLIGLLCQLVPYANAALLTFILANAAALQYNYFFKYNDAHASVIREHERQYTVMVAQNAQRTVQLQADALRLAYIHEHERHRRTTKLYEDLQTEYMMFATTLQRLEPEAFKRTVDALTYVPPKPAPKPAPKPGKEKK